MQPRLYHRTSGKKITKRNMYQAFARIHRELYTAIEASPMSQNRSDVIRAAQDMTDAYFRSITKLWEVDQPKRMPWSAN